MVHSRLTPLYKATATRIFIGGAARASSPQPLPLPGICAMPVGKVAIGVLRTRRNGTIAAADAALQEASDDEMTSLVLMLRLRQRVLRHTRHFNVHLKRHERYSLPALGTLIPKRATPWIGQATTRPARLLAVLSAPRASRPRTCHRPFFVSISV